jgi:hypothetical protein
MNFRPKAIIHKSELDFMSRCVMDFPDLETGGDFFGFWTKEGDPVIQFVIGPGLNTTRTQQSFYQDIDYLKRCGTFLNSKYGLEHIGGWHSHHRLGLTKPSSGDVNTMRNALHDQNLPNFLISICNIDGNSTVSIKGYLFSKGNPNDYTPCNWNILEGISPLRDSLLREDSNLFVSPKTKRAPDQIEIIDLNNNLKNEIEVEKPELALDSYWTKPEGRTYLKNAYEKLKARTDISNVEILQLADKRIALSFYHDGDGYEIQFPEDFPKSDPEVVEKKLDGDNESIPEKDKKKKKSKKKMAKFKILFFRLIS